MDVIGFSFALWGKTSTDKCGWWGCPHGFCPAEAQHVGPAAETGFVRCSFSSELQMPLQDSSPLWRACRIPAIAHFLTSVSSSAAYTPFSVTVDRAGSAPWTGGPLWFLLLYERRQQFWVSSPSAYADDTNVSSICRSTGTKAWMSCCWGSLKGLKGCLNHWQKAKV